MNDKKKIKDLEDGELFWLTIGVDKHIEKKWPEWTRTSAIDKNGVTYAPCGLIGNEQFILIAALSENINPIKDSGHIFLPTKWLSGEYKEWEETLSAIEEKLKARYL
jgi:hypothetical protein